MNKTKNRLSAILGTEPRQQLSDELQKAASVALLLSGPLEDLEVFFIKRATNPMDHWSGHVAFPGGRHDEGDADLLATCLREVREELGISLEAGSQLLGSLDDIQGRRQGHLMSFFIRPYAFYLEKKPDLTPDAAEVAGTEWVPIAALTAASNQTHFSLVRDQVTVKLPAVTLPSGDLLWGLTYMMLQGFLKRLKPALTPGF